MKRYAIFLALLLIAARAAEQPISFRSAPLLPLPAAPKVMVAGDLNDDHRLDLVTAGFSADGSRLVSIFLGSSDGTLQHAGDFDAGGIGQGMLIRDLDGDGMPDILLTEQESDNLWLLHGNGDGTVTAPVRINGGHEPIEVAAADLDGDGKLDLAVSLSAGDEGSNGQVAILRGHGDGTFDDPSIVQLSAFGTEGVVIDDFDHDGVPDIAVASNTPGTISILRGLGQLAFAAPVDLPVGAGIAPLGLGDVDGDGWSDLVAGNTTDDTIAVLRSRGDGTFDPPRPFPIGGSALTAMTLADLNADGHLDVITANVRSQSVSVLLGVGDGTFEAPRSYVADVIPTAVAALDLNGDGLVDLVSSNDGFDNPTLALLLGDGHGRFEAVEQLASAFDGFGAGVADFNEDAIADAVVAFPDEMGIRVFFGSAPGDNLRSHFIDTGAAAEAIAVADLDGDDHFDVVAANHTADLSVLFGTGAGTFVPLHVTLAAAASAVTTADCDVDGHLDIVATLPGAPARLMVLRNTGNRDFVPLLPALTLDARPSTLVAGDFNGDGTPDLAVGDIKGHVVVFLGDGDGTFTAGATLSVTSTPTALVVTDIDGDGHEDLLAIDAGGRVHVLTGDGTGAFTTGGVFSAGNLPSGIAVRDLDGDGVPEVLLADQTANAVNLVRNNGGRLQLDQQVLSSVRPTSVATGDFDGDGRYDVLSAGLTVCRLQNNTTVSVPVRRGDGNGDATVSAADLVALVRELGDGDGTRVDDVARGTYAGHPGVDADGDGVITRVDARATITRLMNQVSSPQ